MAYEVSPETKWLTPILLCNAVAAWLYKITRQDVLLTLQIAIAIVTLIYIIIGIALRIKKYREKP